MLRLSFIFLFKISIGYNMSMPCSKIMKSFAASVAKSKKVLKTISAFLIAVKAELIWYYSLVTFISLKALKESYYIN